MYGKIIINSLLTLCLIIFELSFVSALPGGLNNISLILVVLVFVIGMTSLNTSLSWAILVGFILDIFSFSMFGVHLVSLFLVVLIINLLLTNFFTNRSLYTFLVLTFFATILYEFFSNFLIYLFSLFGGKYLPVFITKDFWQGELIQLFLNLLIVLIIFYSLGFIMPKLKPVFLNKKINVKK